MKLIKNEPKDRLTIYGAKELFEEIRHIADTYPGGPLPTNKVAIALLEKGLEAYKNAIKY